jgi:hypothetical protein
MDKAEKVKKVVFYFASRCEDCQKKRPLKDAGLPQEDGGEHHPNWKRGNFAAKCDLCETVWSVKNEIGRWRKPAVPKPFKDAGDMQA